MMQKIKTLLVFGMITLLFFGCTKDNETTDPTPPPNAKEINLVIWIKNDANLSMVFKTLNTLNFDIREMNGFYYNVNTPATGIPALISLLNQKPYINTGAWSATTSTVYFYAPEKSTRVLNIFFDMNLANQADLLHLIDSLGLKDRYESKYIGLSVPEGKQQYWKTQLLTYSFVTSADAFDQTQVCLSYQHAYIISANVPGTANVNQPLAIPVTFESINGCGGFGEFLETNSGNTKTITLKAKYQGCICTQAVVPIQTTYSFLPTTTGIHTLKFLQPDGTFLTYTIHVQ